MSPYLILIPILLPIAGGALLLLRRPVEDRVRNIYLECVACVTSVLVLALLLFARREPITVYSFIRGFSITFRIDGMATLFAAMLAFMWPFAQLYAFSYMEGSDDRQAFFSFYLMTYGVSLAMAFSANLVTMYVAFEMLTLVTLPLVTHYQNHESLFAGRRYMIYCVAGASLGFVAVVMCTLDGGGIFRWGGSLGSSFAPGLMRAVFLLGFFGFGVKAAVFPLFRWLPIASVAPTPVTALLHAVAVVNSGLFAVARLTWYAFGPDLLLGSAVQTVCVLTAAFSMVFGAVMALRQRQFKRRLAYSTMSNLSYMLLGVALMTPAGLLGGLSHMLFHGVIKMSLFLCAGAFMHVTGREYIFEINGMGRQMPVTFTCYTLGALSLTGVPLFCGFVSKWRLLTASLGAGTAAGTVGAGALLISAFLCAMYTLTISVRAFFPYADTDTSGPSVREADWRMLVPIVLFTVLNLALGVCSGPVIALLSRIAEGLL